ncbi:MAG: polyprenyl synthetase family protein, partial [Candidatus Omnitrophica bacterium]|nr:polyprenyl synthetase family protein [Candidatus Omnitrophota bacterium]
KLIKAALYTGSGEFIELMLATNKMEEIGKNDIYKIYDLKTANYTFATPLDIGATLAGATEKEAKKLFSYGIYLGRAFQIKDDIIGLFGEEKEIGKSNVSDLQEAKKTLLVWYAYNHSARKNKEAIKKVFSKKEVSNTDLLRIRKIIRDSGALDYAQSEIERLKRLAAEILKDSTIKKTFKESLSSFAAETLAL